MPERPPAEPRSVPDEAGELYDAKMAEIRAQREAQDRALDGPLGAGLEAFHDFQSGPKIPRPSTAESFIPVVGPAWEAAGDLQDGNYGGAAFNAAMAATDALPFGTAVKGFHALTKGIGVLKKGSLTAEAARKAIRRAGLADRGEEIHHSIPLNGTPRNVQDWRNHYAFLKSLPQEQHRRLTGSWAGKPRYDPIQRAWYGTTDWMKTVPAGVAAWTADAVQNLQHASSRRAPPNPAPQTRTK